MKPTLFIAGAPKSGTTALCEYLREHPAIFVSRPKEPFFFCEDLPGLPGVRSPREYDALFSKVPAGVTLAAEGSAVYLYSKVALARIREFEPSARIIAMLRSPIEIAPSLHSQLLYNRTEDVEDFERAWELQSERREGRSIPTLCREPALLQYRDVARLGEQIERLYSVFPRDQILVIFFEDFKASPATVYRRVLDFLNLPDDERSEFPRINENKAIRAGWLSRFTQHPPRFLSRAASMARRIVGRDDLSFLDGLRRANSVVRPREPISDRMRKTMISEFSDDVDLLARLTGRDLSAWLASPPDPNSETEATPTDPDR
jgi:hypothetical protein